MKAEQMEWEATQRLLGALVSMQLLPDLSEESELKAQQLAFVACIGYEHRIRELERRLVEHHASGVLDAVNIGDFCPICAELER